MKSERDDGHELAADDVALVEALDRAAELERAIVAEARSGAPSAAELHAVEAALRRAESPRARRLPLALAAAALFLAALLAWRFLSNDGGEPAPGTTLGSGDVEILAPEGAVDAFTVVRWHTTAPNARFDVRVLDAATREVLLNKRDLQGVELALDGHDRSTWQRILVEIDELDSNRGVVDSDRAEAWLR